MRLPFAPPLAPMLSSAADALPGGEGWQFEPKWDGFRTLVFRDGNEILLQSRDEKPMNRYFPELIAPLAATLSERCVVDGEIVIVGVGRSPRMISSSDDEAPVQCASRYRANCSRVSGRVKMRLAGQHGQLMAHV